VVTFFYYFDTNIIDILMNLFAENKSRTYDHTPPIHLPLKFALSQTMAAAAGSRHVVAFPFPGRGHINPMLVVCRQLVAADGALTLLASTTLPDRVRHATIPNVIPSERGRGHGAELSVRSLEEYVPVPCLCPCDTASGRQESKLPSQSRTPHARFFRSFASPRQLPAKTGPASWSVDDIHPPCFSLFFSP
jgi:hypothetical protein